MRADSFWNILGLDGPTGDAKVIRRAYAKTLRATRPDEDPEGFMALREAFERAKTYAQYYAEDSAADMTADDAPPEAAEAVIIEEEETAPAPPPQLTLGGEAPAPRAETYDDFDDEDDDDDGLSTADYLPEAASLPPPIKLPPIEALVNPEPEILPEAPDAPLHDLMEDIEQLLRNGQQLNSKRAWETRLGRAQDLSLDDYNQFEHQLRGKLLRHFGYHERESEPQNGRKKRKRKRRAKRKLSQDTAVYIFKYLGWNRWKSYPAFVQEELLWMLYELGIKDRPKVEETGKATLLSEFRYLMKCFGVVLIFALLGNYFEPPEDNTPPPAPLPDAGETTYGSYSYDRDAGSWSYKLSGDSEALRALQPGDELRDTFKFQPNETQINTVLIKITGTEGVPEITNTDVPQEIKAETEEGWHTIFYLIAGIAALFAFFRLVGFVIGVIIVLFRLAFQIIGAFFRRLFGR